MMWVKDFSERSINCSGQTSVLSFAVDKMLQAVHAPKGFLVTACIGNGQESED